MFKLSHFMPVWTQAFWSWEREGKTKQWPQERPIPKPPVAQCVESPYPSLESLVHWKHIRGLKLSPSDVSLNHLSGYSQVVPTHLFFVGVVIPWINIFLFLDQTAYGSTEHRPAVSGSTWESRVKPLLAKLFPWNRSVNTHFRISRDMVKCTAATWDWTCRSLV